MTCIFTPITCIFTPPSSTFQDFHKFSFLGILQVQTSRNLTPSSSNFQECQGQTSRSSSNFQEFHTYKFREFYMYVHIIYMYFHTFKFKLPGNSQVTQLLHHSYVFSHLQFSRKFTPPISNFQEIHNFDMYFYTNEFQVQFSRFYNLI